MKYSRETEAALEAARQIDKEADRERRELTAGERGEVQAALDAADREKGVAQFEAQVGGGSYRATDPAMPLGRPGDAFVQSEGNKKIRDAAARPSQWSSGPVEIKSDLFEGDIDTPGIGGALVQPDVQPGIQETLYQPLTVADLFGSATTTSNTVRFMAEVAGSVVNAADSVAEGGTKPEFGRPKSKRSSRSVPMHDRVGQALERHYQEAHYTTDDDLVFCHPQIGSPLDSSNVLDRFKEALAAAGIRPLRFHDLRHTFGAQMAAQGCRC